MGTVIIIFTVTITMIKYIYETGGVVVLNEQGRQCRALCCDDFKS